MGLVPFALERLLTLSWPCEDSAEGIKRSTHCKSHTCSWSGKQGLGSAQGSGLPPCSWPWLLPQCQVSDRESLLRGGSPSTNPSSQIQLGLFLIQRIHQHLFSKKLFCILTASFVVCAVKNKSDLLFIILETGLKQKLLLLSHFSSVRLCATPETAAHQAPLSLGFSKQELITGY